MLAPKKDTVQSHALIQTSVIKTFTFLNPQNNGFCCALNGKCSALYSNSIVSLTEFPTLLTTLLLRKPSKVLYTYTYLPVFTRDLYSSWS